MPFLLNTMSSVAALTGDDLYLKNAPEKMLGRYLLLRIRYPYKFNTGTDGAAQAVLGAHKAELLDSALGKFDMKYGETESHAPYVGVSGSQLRRIHKLCTRREVNVGFSAGDAVVDLVVPFSLDALSDGRSRLPGWTQLRTMHLRYKEGAAVSETSPAAPRSSRKSRR